MAEGRKTQNSAEDVVRITYKSMPATGVHVPWFRIMPASSFNQGQHQNRRKCGHALLKGTSVAEGGLEVPSDPLSASPNSAFDPHTRL